MQNLTGHSRKNTQAALTMAALGIVYGDIGTSPLYAFREVFAVSNRLMLSEQTVLGVLSLFFWSLFIVVAIKYVVVVMRADNKGEGGIIALTALALHKLGNEAKLRSVVVVLGLFGAAFFYGDGVITPAISVLSAVEGLQVIAPTLKPWVMPISLLVIVGLFVFQKKGTASVGALFGPVMLLWFVTLAGLGIRGILQAPQVLCAISPIYAYRYLEANAWVGFVSLGAVVLCITGAEALYADMGHFGRSPIQRSCFLLVLPTLILNYFGQGALVLSDPNLIAQPFYFLAPESLRYPLVVLSTLATVIASQAVISGAFSLSKQAMNMGYTPAFNVIYTSDHEVGQIYVPAINWVLMFLIIMLVLTFESSARLAAAYGIAVTGTMLITDLLALVVAIRHWKWHPALAVAVMMPFVIVDIGFYSANILKIPDGGWFPMLFAGTVFLLFVTWKQGRDLLRIKLNSRKLDLRTLANQWINASMPRIDGVAVFFTHDASAVPGSLLHSLKHFQTIHRQVFVVGLCWQDIPHVPVTHRYEIEIIGNGFSSIRLNLGFKDDVDIPLFLKQAPKIKDSVDWDRVSYFLGKDTLIPQEDSLMPYWQEMLFIALYRVSANATNYFKLPINRVVEMGAQIPL